MLIEKYFFEKYFFETKKFPKNIPMKKSMKNENFEISKNFVEKIEISKFSFFVDFFIGQFSEIFWSRKNIFRKNIFSIKHFFDQTFVSEKCFDHIFRSPKSPRFQKSYLESRVMSLNRRKTSEFKNAKFFCRDSRILVTFGDMLCITTLQAVRFVFEKNVKPSLGRISNAKT